LHAVDEGVTLARYVSASLVGQIVLGRYLIEEELGQGAMGCVFRGRHVKLPRRVAIKVLHTHLVHQKNMLERFRREAKIAALLHHPNVISVLDYGESIGHEVMVMELAQGRVLRAFMASPLPRERIFGLVRQILKGLDHAHVNGLIHRDLKPENIIVEVTPGGDELARIVDFGIAVLRDPDESAAGGKLTASGQVLGTPLYMAPEQAKCEAFDHRIDLFALGVIVYEMLAGLTPFDGTAMEIAIANINCDPPPIARRAPGVTVDPLLEAFARRLMARELADRVASTQDALALLELVEHDREHAALALGIMDVAKALGVVSLPAPPAKR
jgi:serine/threonine-protein kinase